MSRSRKKVPNVNNGNKVDKQIHKRRLRHGNKIRVEVGAEPLLEEEVIDRADIRDYNKTYFNNEPEKQKLKRK